MNNPQNPADRSAVAEQPLSPQAPIRECLHSKLELTTLLYVNNNPVPDFIVVVSNFVVGFPTLLLFDNNKMFIKNKVADPTLSFYVHERIFRAK